MRKVAVLSTTRADFGLLSKFIQRCANDSEIELQLLVSGMHLLPELGNTWREVEAFGVPITQKIPLYDTNVDYAELATCEGAANALSQCIVRFTQCLSVLKPDVLVVLGDRFEILSVVQAALLHNIPIAHIHGGEITEGAIDEAVRHAVTKFSSLHFVATESYRRRVVQLGESPQTVFNVGAPALEALTDFVPQAKDELESGLGFPLSRKTLIVTYHPETLSTLTPKAQIQCLLTALATLPDYFLLFTAPNVDVGGGVIIEAIKNFVVSNNGRAKFIPSLGLQRYFSVLHYAGAVIGNSSSGIIEVPSFGLGTVNIGGRQAGRARANSVIDVGFDPVEIAAAVEKAQSIHACAELMDNPYQQTGSSEKMIAIIKQMDFSKGCRKLFYDIPLSLGDEAIEMGE